MKININTKMGCLTENMWFSQSRITENKWGKSGRNQILKWKKKEQWSIPDLLIFLLFVVQAWKAFVSFPFPLSGSSCCFGCWMLSGLDTLAGLQRGNMLFLAARNGGYLRFKQPAFLPLRRSRPLTSSTPPPLAVAQGQNVLNVHRRASSSTAEYYFRLCLKYCSYESTEIRISIDLNRMLLRCPSLSDKGGYSCNMATLFFFPPFNVQPVNTWKGKNAQIWQLYSLIFSPIESLSDLKRRILSKHGNPGLALVKTDHFWTVGMLPEHFLLFVYK